MKFLGHWVMKWSVWGTSLLAGSIAWSEDFVWSPSSPGVDMIRMTNPGPVVCAAVRMELARFNADLVLTTTLASNTVVGLEPLTQQIRALPQSLGTAVAAINGDFFLVNGPAKGDPRGLHIWNGELVSVATGPAAFWQDAEGKFRIGKVSSRLQVVWPDGATNLAGLNEPLGTNELVLFTPRLGVLNPEVPRTNARAATRASETGPRAPQPMRPPGGREWTLEPVGAGPWLPLRVGQTYQARLGGSRDGFTKVPPGNMLMSLGPKLVAKRSDLTSGSLITIQVVTEPDLSGVQTALGTGPMLVHQGRRYETVALSSQQPHPRSALGWNDHYFYLAVADGRQKGFSEGFRLVEMADFLMALGCQEAINMDGGLSTLLLLNGTPVNHPSMTRGRPIANGIVVLRRPSDPHQASN